jgi:hypothetical protein
LCCPAEVGWRITREGDVTVQLESSLQLTKRHRFNWQWDLGNDYQLSIDYEFNKQWLLSVSHDVHYGTGIGITTQF